MCLAMCVFVLVIFFFATCRVSTPHSFRQKVWQFLRIKAGIFDLSHPKNEPSEEAKDLIRWGDESRGGRVGRRTMEEVRDAVDIDNNGGGIDEKVYCESSILHNLNYSTTP